VDELCSRPTAGCSCRCPLPSPGRQELCDLACRVVRHPHQVHVRRVPDTNPHIPDGAIGVVGRGHRPVDARPAAMARRSSSSPRRPQSRPAIVRTGSAYKVRSPPQDDGWAPELVRISDDRVAAGEVIASGGDELRPARSPRRALRAAARRLGRAWIAPFRGSFPDVRMQVVDLVAKGNKVVGRFLCSAPNTASGRVAHPPADLAVIRVAGQPVAHGC
jgi:hypothetical protein